MVCFANSKQYAILSCLVRGEEPQSPLPALLVPLLTADGRGLTDGLDLPCLVRPTGGADTSTAPRMAGADCAGRHPQKWRMRICD